MICTTERLQLNMAGIWFPITGSSLAVLPFDIAFGTQVVKDALATHFENTESLIKASTRVVCEYYKLFQIKPVNVDFEDFLCGSRRKGIMPHQLWQAQIQAHMDLKWKIENPVEGCNFIYKNCRFKDLEDFLQKCGQRPLSNAAYIIKRQWRIEREVAMDLMCK